MARQASGCQGRLIPPHGKYFPRIFRYFQQGNANGLWVFLSLTSKRRVRQLGWTKMVTSELVIRRMNELAGYFPVAPLFADDDLPQQSPPDQAQMENSRQTNPNAGHVVNPTIETNIALVDEAVEQKEKPQISTEVVTIEGVEATLKRGISIQGWQINQRKSQQIKTHHLCYDAVHRLQKKWWHKQHCKHQEVSQTCTGYCLLQHGRQSKSMDPLHIKQWLQRSPNYSRQRKLCTF